MKKTLIITLSVILVFAMTLNACGNKETPETAAATVATTAAATAPAETAAPIQPLTLTDWNMNATTWSSPNGATVHITATPNYYAEGQKADFVIRLESDDISTTPCQWDGTSYTASADLNAANGYCYYVILTAADGTVTEVAVNTPAEPSNQALIDMEAALESYCSLIVEESSVDNGQLLLTSGNIQVQTPRITNEGAPITCQEAVLVLLFNGEVLEQKVLPLTQSEAEGLFEAALENIVFEIPELEEGQSVELSVNAALSNGQLLTAFGGSWFYEETGLLPMVG